MLLIRSLSDFCVDPESSTKTKELPKDTAAKEIDAEDKRDAPVVEINGSGRALEEHAAADSSPEEFTETPAPSGQSSIKFDGAASWKEYCDENGYAYLYNPLTGETKWKEVVEETASQNSTTSHHVDPSTIAKGTSILPSTEDKAASNDEPLTGETKWNEVAEETASQDSSTSHDVDQSAITKGVSTPPSTEEGNSANNDDPWEEYYDEQGNPYLYNISTGESKWKEVQEKDSNESEHSQPPKAPSDDSNTNGLEAFSPTNLQSERPSSPSTDLKKPLEPSAQKKSKRCLTEKQILYKRSGSTKLPVLPTPTPTAATSCNNKPARKGGRLHRKRAAVLVGETVKKSSHRRKRRVKADIRVESSSTKAQHFARSATPQLMHKKRRGQHAEKAAGSPRQEEAGVQAKEEGPEAQRSRLFKELLAALHEDSQRVPKAKLLKKLVHCPWRLAGIREHCKRLELLFKPRSFHKAFNECCDGSSIGLEDFLEACARPKRLIAPVLETLRTTIPIHSCKLNNVKKYVALGREPYCRVERRIQFDEEIVLMERKIQEDIALHDRRLSDKDRREKSRRGKWQVDRKRKEARELRHRKKWLVKIVSQQQRKVRNAAETELRAQLSRFISQSASVSGTLSDTRVNTKKKQMNPASSDFSTPASSNPYSSVGVEALLLSAPEEVQDSFSKWLKAQVLAAEDEVSSKLSKRRDAFHNKQKAHDTEEKQRRKDFDVGLQEEAEAFNLALQKMKHSLRELRRDEKTVRLLEDDVFGELYKQRAAFLNIVTRHALRHSLRRLKWIRTNFDAQGEHHLVKDGATQEMMNLSMLPCKDLQHAQRLMLLCQRFHALEATGCVLHVQDWFFHHNDSCVEAFVLYEYTQAPTLRHWMESPQETPENMVLELAQNLALALREMHRIDLVHCGISPSAVRVVGDYKLKVELPVLFKFEDVRTVVDEAYMAPEMRRNGATALAKPVDIWAYGATIYSLLTKEKLATKATVVAASTHVRHRKIVAVHKWARTLLKMTLKASPEERATIDEVLALFYREGDDTRMQLEQAIEKGNCSSV